MTIQSHLGSALTVGTIAFSISLPKPQVIGSTMILTIVIFIAVTFKNRHQTTIYKIILVYSSTSVWNIEGCLYHYFWGLFRVFTFLVYCKIAFYFLLIVVCSCDMGVANVPWERISYEIFAVRVQLVENTFQKIPYTLRAFFQLNRWSQHDIITTSAFTSTASASLSMIYAQSWMRQQSQNWMGIDGHWLNFSVTRISNFNYSHDCSPPVIIFKYLTVAWSILAWSFKNACGLLMGNELLISSYNIVQTHFFITNYSSVLWYFAVRIEHKVHAIPTVSFRRSGA